MSDPFHIVAPKGAIRPILISCPHVGIEIPGDVARVMRPGVAEAVADTDWFVHELYGFAPALGITLIHARFSRYVIDLNRDPAGRSLYADDRLQTALVPTQTFAGEPIYRDSPPDGAETQRRLALYFQPYHAKVASLLRDLRSRHEDVLFYDAHSIRRLVPTIRSAPFPDMILGDQQGKTAAPALSEAAARMLGVDGTYTVSRNDPFMGGYLTRSFGKPESGVHALQLEMVQDIYMDEDRSARDRTKQTAVESVLAPMLGELARTLETLR